MTESNRPARFICYPNGEVEDLRPVNVEPDDGPTNQHPEKRKESTTSNGWATAGGTVGMLVVMLLLRMVQALPDKRPNLFNHNETKPTRFIDGSHNPLAVWHVSNNLMDPVDLQQNPDEDVNPLRTTIALLNKSQSALTIISQLNFDLVAADPELNKKVKGVLTQVDEYLDLVEEYLCDIAAAVAGEAESPAVEGLLKRVADLRGQATSISLQLNPVPQREPNGEGNPSAKP